MTLRKFHRWQLHASRTERSRRGAILIVALVCLLVVTGLLGTMLQGTLRAHRQLHTERDRRQTDLLLQAGMDRAAFRLANEPDYRGETWDLPAAAILGTREGRVTIAASHDSEQAPWQVYVLAEYPFGNDLSIRRSRTFEIMSPTTKRQELTP
jgi:hypothetical protein